MEGVYKGSIGEESNILLGKFSGWTRSLKVPEVSFNVLKNSPYEGQPIGDMGVEILCLRKRITEKVLGQSLPPNDEDLQKDRTCLGADII